MTSSSHRNSRPRGFTLVELLVVIGIIVLLATIVLPMANHAYNVAKRTRMAADLQVIGEALEAYRHDFGDYPRPPLMPETPYVTGAARLCWALVAPGPAVSPSATNPGDGADGPGFRLRGTTGTIHGPYLPPDRFKIGIVVHGFVVAPLPGGQGTPDYNDSQDVLADRNDSPILYFVAARNASPSTGFVGNAAGSVFNFDENKIYVNQTAGDANPIPLSLMGGSEGWKVMAYRLGDIGPGMPNGIIDPNETAVATGPYLLWCAGPSVFGRFGNDDDVVSNGTELQLVSPLKPGLTP